MEKKEKLILIKTDKCCYISDCFAKEGTYDWEYHNSIIPKLFFDGESAIVTWTKNWYRIAQYPQKIKICVPPQKINLRYEIKNQDNISKKLPKIILYKNRKDYDSDVLDNIYDLKYDMSSASSKKYDIDIETVCEVDNFIEPCDLSYKTTNHINYKDRVYNITSADVCHSMIDKIILPEILRTNRPCKFTSKQMYDITRQYVKDHIDEKMATITKDYDFCFTVEKIVPLLEPKEVAYSHIFARTKREREKIRYKTLETKHFKIFSMTHDQENYQGYTVIDGMFANSEPELKGKVDLWLVTLINIINKPIQQCPHCEGKGYIEVPPYGIRTNDVIRKISEEAVNDVGSD